MPTYVYACTSCGERTEVVQRITDDPLTTCQVCSGALRKVFQPVGVVFKGSGFYKTDSRSGSSGSKPAAAGGEPAKSEPAPKEESGSGDGSSGGSTDSTTSSTSSTSTASGSAPSSGSSGKSGNGSKVA